MLTIFFATTTVICGVGWIANKLSVMTIVTYMLRKGYEPPSADEMETCRNFVAKHIAEDIRRKLP